jgi:hypothetical protein
VTSFIVSVKPSYKDGVLYPKLLIKTHQCNLRRAFPCSVVSCIHVFCKDGLSLVTKLDRAFEMKVFARIGNVMISSCNHLLFSLVVRPFGLSQRLVPELAQYSALFWG